MNAPLTSLLCLALLAGLLGAALWHDLRTRRIPNRLVLWGTVGGVLLNSMLPAGAGLFQQPFGGLGLLQSLAGAAAGLALLLPMYLLRALGAGDVKLMAMCGAFLGPLAVLEAVLLTLLAGGVLAIAAAAGLLSGWAVSALVVGPLAWSSAGAELATPLRPALPPLLALLLAGAVAVALIVAWLARTVRAQALDAEYREEVR